MKANIVASVFTIVLVALTGCPFHHSASPLGIGSNPGCTIQLAPGILLTNPPRYTNQNNTLTATTYNLPRGAKLTYSWAVWPNLGRLTGSGKKVNFDATSVEAPSVDVTLAIFSNDSEIASCYQEVRINH